jgi:membrane protease YdiL (CAAX protease family)
MPAVKLSAGGFAVLFGVTDAPFNLVDATTLLARPGEFLMYLGFLLLLGPLPEEIGWRGYLLDRLQLRFSALGASLLLGITWFAWHGPLFFMTGYYARAGEAPEPLQFGAMILLISVLYTWIHNHTGRSVLAAILFHFSVNAAGELLDAPDSVAAYEAYLTAALALFVLWGWGAETLRGREPGEA